MLKLLRTSDVRRLHRVGRMTQVEIRSIQPRDALRTRIEAFLATLNCGLRKTTRQTFDVVSLKDGAMIMRSIDLVQFARTNGLSDQA